MTCEWKHLEIVSDIGIGCMTNRHQHVTEMGPRTREWDHNEGMESYTVKEQSTWKGSDTEMELNI